jgi:hypothetical protein
MDMAVCFSNYFVGRAYNLPDFDFDGGAVWGFNKGFPQNQAHFSNSFVTDLSLGGGSKRKNQT